MKIVGMMPVYEEADWVEWAVEGIIDFVDELVIAEGYQGPKWHFGTCRSKDGTIDIINKLAKKYNKITVTQSHPGRHVLKGRAATYNHMLKVSKLMKEANWCMICDADEFYSEDQKKIIKRTLETTSNDAFEFSARFFFYNFKYFYVMTLPRLFRVTKGMFFLPGQVPFYREGRPYYSDTNPLQLLLADNPMFHYSFVRKPSHEIRRRIIEYCAAQRYSYVLDWIDQVFLKWTPEKAEEIYQLNAEKFRGKGGIIFDGNCEAQKLRIYEGEHPNILDAHPFRYIDDIRLTEKLSLSAKKSILLQHRIAHYSIRLMRFVFAVIRDVTQRSTNNNKFRVRNSIH